MANLEEQHRLSEESWKNDMDDIEQRVEEESNRRAFAQEEFDENIIEARTPKSKPPTYPSAPQNSTPIISRSERTPRRSSRKRKRVEE